jgi:hypothetical protein
MEIGEQVEGGVAVKFVSGLGLKLRVVLKLELKLKYVTWCDFVFSMWAAFTESNLSTTPTNQF